MVAMPVNMQELANSWWHYVISLDRALERERMEFKDGCLIAADIAFRASGKNPLSWHQTFDVLQHGQTLMTRGLLSNQEEFSRFALDQFEDWMKAYAKRRGRDDRGFMRIDELVPWNWAAAAHVAAAA